MDDLPTINDGLETCEVEVIRLQTKSGGMIQNALREALTLAVEQWALVEVEHNERVFRFDPQAIIGSTHDEVQPEACSRQDESPKRTDDTPSHSHGSMP